MRNEMKTAASAMAVAPWLSARRVIFICPLLEGDCHIELQLEGDRDVGQFDKAAG
jgi:hypothetical protein